MTTEVLYSNLGIEARKQAVAPALTGQQLAEAFVNFIIEQRVKLSQDFQANTEAHRLWLAGFRTEDGCAPYILKHNYGAEMRGANLFFAFLQDRLAQSATTPQPAEAYGDLAAK